MKKSLYLTGFGLAAVLFACPVVTQAQITLNSVGVGASYWKPSLDYWNNRSFLIDYNRGQGATLAGRVMPTAALDIGLFKGFSAGVRAAYWKNSAESTLSIAGINRTEKLSLSIVPVSLDLKYSLASPKTDGEGKVVRPSLIPYIGVGLTHYFVTNDFSRQVISASGSLNESNKGATNGVQVIAGVEKRLTGLLYLALDVRYHLGNYNQAVTARSTTTTESVSLNGLDAGLALRLKLAKQ